jgi:hypothetical protein
MWQGMKPSFWSSKMNRNLEEGESGWIQDCSENVGYELSPYSREINELNPQRVRNYYQLSFDYTFQYHNDEVFCAYTVPYTYTQSIAHIKLLKALNDENRKYCFYSCRSDLCPEQPTNS